MKTQRVRLKKAATKPADQDDALLAIALKVG